MIESNFTASSEIKEILIYALLATVMQSSTVVQADKLNRKRNTKKVLMVMSAQKYVRLINEERFKALICISFASKLLVLKTKYNKKNKVNIVTLGCSKNLVDSEVILTQLRGNEITATHEAKEDDANIVIINTCGFIDNAKQESIDTILRYADAKADGEIEKVYVTGCLSQRYRDDLKNEIPEVDAWFGTMELPMLLKKFNATYKHELLGERITTTDQHYAYMKISEGCDRPCSFCAIPLMRGKHVSRPMDQLVQEAKSLVSRGTKEILLIAQDSTYYGLDIYKDRKLAELLDRLSDVEGLEWIRLHYAFPTGFPLDILDIMASKPNICNYLDIPLQHGATDMLKIMRRGTTREKTEQLLDTIRTKVPDIAIRTTLIAGHPGETEAHFEEMMSFVEKSRFERLGIFTYSHEEQTHAFSLPDDIPQEVKEDRANQVMGLQQEISSEINSQKIGKEFKVLIDRVEGGNFIGRTEYDSPEVDNEVIIDASKHYLRQGDFATIKITDASEFDLFGEPV
ncbi:MAG: ribosomal protein S12 methylthiotransferase [Cellvibrionaceae bacterium]